MPRSRSITGALAATCLLVLQACDDPTLGEPKPGPAVPGAEALAQNPDAAVAEVAQTVARALSQPEIRHLVLKDLRDSPFADHKIHLQSYLRGESGRHLAAAAAQGAGMTTEQFLTTVGALRYPLEFGMHRAYDRATWTGSDNLIVAGTAADLDRVGHETPLPAFDLQGKQIPLKGSDAPWQVHILYVAGTDINFGSDPETTRAAAPEHGRNTISTREEETGRSKWIRSASSAAGVLGSRSPSFSTSSTSDGYAADPGYSYGECLQTGPDGDAATEDEDRDGFRDSCEQWVAEKFLPLLHFGRDEYIRSRETRWSVIDGIYPNEVRIFYAIGYHDDSGHPGDSEFIFIDALYDADGRWKLYWIFLSAHWNATGDRSKYMPYSDVPYYADVYRGRPKIWVGENKHANFESIERCNHNRLFTVDECDTPLLAIEYMEYFSTDNVGNDYDKGYTELIGGRCTSDPKLYCLVYSREGLPGWEVYWGGSFDFKGWHGDTGTTPYAKSLRYYGL